MIALFRETERPPRFVAIFAVGLACVVIGCNDEGSVSRPVPPPPSGADVDFLVPDPAAKVPAKVVEAEPGPFRFAESGKESGIDFVQVSGMTTDRHFPTANGSGLAILDYDGDGLMDLYFATCNLLPLAPRPEASNRLYKNLGEGKFLDVTDASGVGFRGFCHGVIAADLDNDGDPDMLLCNYGANVLYLNNGDGTFRDASGESELDSTDWSSGGAALDFDNDGDLDLYVTNYGAWDIDNTGPPCYGDDKKTIRMYCSPRSIRTVRHILYKNDGLRDGVPHFTDVTVEAGVSRDTAGPGDQPDYGHGFGAVASDLDDDGKIDLYVANDQNPAFLFLNQGGGKFLDQSNQSGAAFDANGGTQSGMGLDAADVNGDGLPDLIRTNFKDETTSYYENQGHGAFLEQSSFVGLSAPTLPWVKWGCGLRDFDNDGWPDVFITNGHVDDNNTLLGKTNEPYEQPPSLLRNLAGKRFVPSEAGAGPYFHAGHVGRGCAFGDLDNDGREDIVVNHKDAAPAVLLNRSETGNHWVRLVLRGTRTNRDAIGAKVQVTAGDLVIHRQRKGGGSMESTNDPRLLIGVGPATSIARIVVKWPSGAHDSVLENVDADRTIVIEEPSPEF